MNVLWAHFLLLNAGQVNPSLSLDYWKVRSHWILRPVGSSQENHKGYTAFFDIITSILTKWCPSKERQVLCCPVCVTPAATEILRVKTTRGAWWLGNALAILLLLCLKKKLYFLRLKPGSLCVFPALPLISNKILHTLISSFCFSSCLPKHPILVTT